MWVKFSFRVRVIKNGWYCSLNQICLLLIGTQLAPLNPDWQQTDPSRNVSHKVLCTDLAKIRLFSNVLSIFFLILHLSETDTCWFHVQTLLYNLRQHTEPYCGSFLDINIVIHSGLLMTLITYRGKVQIWKIDRTGKCKYLIQTKIGDTWQQVTDGWSIYIYRGFAWG